MLIDILFFMFLGILLGTVTGLVPGLHPNTVFILMVSLAYGLSSSVSPILVLVFIISILIFVASLAMGQSGCPHMGKIGTYDKIGRVDSIRIYRDLFLVNNIRGGTALNPVKVEVWLVINSP